MNITNFAKRCNVSRLTIYNAIEAGKVRRDSSGGIDINHPDTMQYIADRDAGLTDKHKPKRPRRKNADNKSTKTAQSVKPGATQSQALTQSQKSVNVAAMDSRELQDELTRQRVIELNLKNQTKSKDLLEHETVLNKFVYPMQDALKKIVGDLSQTIPLKAYEIVKDGGTVQEAQAEALKIINRAIGANVRKIEKGLRDVK